MTTYKAADIKNWSRRAKRNLELVIKQSIQDVSELAQTPKAQGGRMPVDTGFLRNTYTAEGLSGPDAYVAAVASFQIGATFQAGWTAAYALRMEKGFVGEDSLGRTYNQPGNFFMETALMQWQDINNRNAAKLRD